MSWSFHLRPFRPLVSPNIIKLGSSSLLVRVLWSCCNNHVSELPINFLLVKVKSVAASLVLHISLLNKLKRVLINCKHLLRVLKDASLVVFLPTYDVDCIMSLNWWKVFRKFSDLGKRDDVVHLCLKIMNSERPGWRIEVMDSWLGNWLYNIWLKGNCVSQNTEKFVFFKSHFDFGGFVDRDDVIYLIKSFQTSFVFL